MTILGVRSSYSQGVNTKCEEFPEVHSATL